MGLTEEQKKKYVEGSDCCPYCDSEDYSGEGPREGYAGVLELLYDLECNSCKKKWLATYKLSDVVDLD